MKIAFLTSEYPHEKTGKSGGIGTSIHNLALGLIQAGHQVRVLVYGQKSEAVFVDKEIVVQQIKNVKVKGLSLYLTQKKLEKIIDGLHKTNQIDLVEAPDWTGITSFIRPKKCPILIRLHGSDTYFCHLDKRPVKWINKFMEKTALRHADSHASVSQYTAQVTNSLFGLNINFEIIPNGLSSGNPETEKRNNSDVPVVLYFGTLIRKKGLLELPFIFNKVVEDFPEAELHLLGKDASDVITNAASTWEMMKSLFSAEALKRVHYKGEVSYDKVKDKIEQAAVCVFPTFAEALPVSWLEAMAMKKAIVASNIGWANEMITNDVEGILVHPTEHEKFAKAIVSVLKDESKAKFLGENAYQKVKRDFGIDLVVEKNILWYKKVIEKCS